MSKGPLANREIGYRFNRCEIDVTHHKESKEYRQMRLLVGCTAAIKAKQQNRYKSVENSPVKKEADNQESSVPMTPKVNYKSSVPPITPTMSVEVNLLNSMNIVNEKMKDEVKEEAIATGSTSSDSAVVIPVVDAVVSAVPAPAPVDTKNNKKRLR